MKTGWFRILLLATCGFGACEPGRTDIAVPGSEPRALAVGDVNGDGKDEIIVGHDLTSNAADELVGASVLVSTAQGDALRSSLVGLTDFEPDKLLLVDLNGDGILDLVASRDLGDQGGTVRILLGRGDGTFTTAGQLEEVGSPIAVAAGDLDNDGMVDLVVSGAGAGAPLQVHWGRGDGTFERPELYYNVRPTPQLAVGDVNGDGKLEVVLGTDDGHVDVMLNDGTGALLAPIRTSVGEGQVVIALAKLGSVGWPQILAAPAKGSTLSVVTGFGTRFARQTSPIQSPVDAIAAGDVDGDGDVEIVTLDTAGNAISMLKRTSSGSYATAKTIAVGSDPVALALANLHGASTLDAITANQGDGTVSVIHFYPEAQQQVTIPAKPGLMPSGPIHR